MSLHYRQFIAVFLAIWLPLSGGHALAVSLTMQMPAAHCHDEAMSDMDMDDMVMGEQDHVAADEHHPSCNACGVCHLACTGYFGVQGTWGIAVQIAARDITPYLVAFNSHTSAPLLPPPLARV